MTAGEPTPAGGAGPARPAAEAAPSRLVTRIGLAIVRPRWALAVAADRRAAGRSGTDLIALIAIAVVVAKLPGLVGAIWLGAAIGPGVGLSVVSRLLTDALVTDLGFLVLGALVLWAGAGPRRNLGRAFDLACVAAIPLFVVDLGAIAAARALGPWLAAPVSWIAIGAGWAWSGALFALAWRPARLAPPSTPPPPREAARLGRRAGWGVVAAAALGAALQVAWIVRNPDLLRPIDDGMEAPAFALPAIGPGGELGPAFTLGKGRVTVLDFWATWCDPCIKAMPKLEALAGQHPEVDVVTINLDDAAAARALFDQRGWTRLRLLADDEVVSRRYTVTTIPHSVVIDRGGIVRHVLRGGSAGVEAAVRAELLRK